MFMKEREYWGRDFAIRLGIDISRANFRKISFFKAGNIERKSLSEGLALPVFD